jgi:hypothetical protein
LRVIREFDGLVQTTGEIQGVDTELDMVVKYQAFMYCAMPVFFKFGKPTAGHELTIQNLLYLRSRMEFAYHIVSRIDVYI